jgi:hypothetical protein
MISHPNTNLCVGIGYGSSLKSAEQNAEDANDLCNQKEI